MFNDGSPEISWPVEKTKHRDQLFTELLKTSYCFLLTPILIFLQVRACSTQRKGCLCLLHWLHNFLLQPTTLQAKKRMIRPNAFNTSMGKGRELAKPFLNIFQPKPRIIWIPGFVGMYIQELSQIYLFTSRGRFWIFISMSVRLARGKKTQQRSSRNTYWGKG